MERQIKALLFDFGGTLDTDGTHWFHVFEKAYAEMGRSVETDALRDAYVHAERTLGEHHDTMILATYGFLETLTVKTRVQGEYLGVNTGFIDHICYKAVLDNISAVAEPVLKAFKERGVPMIAVSNYYGNLESVLAELGLLTYFQEVIDSTLVKVRKPDPAIFGLGVQAAAKYVDGLTPADCLVVGDSISNDMLPGTALGCRTAWLHGQGWTDDVPADFHPDYEISSLAELPGLVLEQTVGAPLLVSMNESMQEYLRKKSEGNAFTRFLRKLFR